MNRSEEIYNYLSVGLRNILSRLEPEISIREIRLRVEKPLIVNSSRGELFIDGQGSICRPQNAYTVTVKDIRETLEYVSNYSMYAYEEEIKNGFITMAGGNRIGVCGRAVSGENGIKTIRNISFINLRVASEIKGCSDMIMDKLYSDVKGSVYHTLIVSPPCCGKTTLLRDIIRNLSDGFGGNAGQTVGVADERSEIAACNLGVPQNDVGMRTDVLDGCPKAYGMTMLIRSMAPRVIAVDEIGSDADVKAITYAVNCGCKIIATVHASSYEDLLTKPAVKNLMDMNVFERVVVLSGLGGPGNVEGIYDAKGERI